MKIVAIVLVLIFFLYSLVKTTETTKVLLSVTTSTFKDADTEGRVFFTINMDKKKRYVLDIPQHKDRFLGAKDSYEFTIEYPMDKITDVTLSIESSDAWKMKEFVVQFISDGKYSIKYLANNPKWLSNEDHDIKKMNAKPEYTYKIDMKYFDYKNVPTIYLNSEK